MAVVAPVASGLDDRDAVDDVMQEVALAAVKAKRAVAAFIHCVITPIGKKRTIMKSMAHI